MIFDDPAVAATAHMHGERSYPLSAPEVRGEGPEEPPHVQGKEPWLCFAGAAVKRYPTSKVRETRVRQ